ncbi:DUF4276 family protein [Brucella sp. IR073]|uniref:DUF4276 family protein n=1 Tax=unclassified Brucella TaxID=2632610 RepID=UPI003B9866E4
MTHLEVLVEDSSGKASLEFLLPKILPSNVSFRIISYKGIGTLPKGLTPNSDPNKRILLDQLPRLISGYGKAFANDAPGYRRWVVIICDLDDRDKQAFENEIAQLVIAASPKPPTIICLAIEEGEAWLLGDSDAVLEAYPHVSRADLARYVPDEICGTWEFMADLIEKGGAKGLKKLGFYEVGQAKHRWATNIAPLIDIQRNKSPSFAQLVKALLESISA